jgi:RNA 2',3'-cyclic 3'-phosphodiesterase
MNRETSSVRLFVAAALPEWLPDSLENHYLPYRHESVRLVPRENLHLTLHFIGPFPQAQVPALEEKLSGLAKTHSAFRLRPEEIAPGPSLRHPRLIWARFAPDPAFEELSLALAEELGGNAKPHPHPIPHVTLARFRKDRAQPEHLPVTNIRHLPAVDIGSLSLWQSHLGQPQPRYEVLKTYGLKLMNG